MSFVHLHLHTIGSHLDGLIRPDELFKKCKELGMSALAITDHGNMSGIVECYKKAKEYEIKLIPGFEAYFVDDATKKESREMYHLILLAKNIEGYRNLLRLQWESYKPEHFYYKPRIDWRLLEKYKDGLIVTSACFAGNLSQYLHISFGRNSFSDVDKAYEYANRFKQLLGEDFYIEIHNHFLREEIKVLPFLVYMARELNIPIVAGQDAHYLTREDAESHRVELAIQTKKTIEEFYKGGFEGFASCDEIYFKSPEEMKELFKQYPDAIENTIKIAEKCNVKIPEFENPAYRFPNFVPPDNKTPDEYLRELAEKGYKERIIDKGLDSEVYRERLERELKEISEMGFSTYFLVLDDFLKFARDNGIRRGPARGSVAGSLVAYCTKVTDVDPIRFGLLWERFLNKDRVTLPDADLDIDQDRRDEITEYLRQKYGYDKVVLVGTRSEEKTKIVIKDVARVLGLDFNKVNNFTKKIPDDIKSVNKLIDTVKDPEFKKVLEIAKRLENIPRHSGVHAAGLVIYPEPVYEYMPVRFENGKMISQLDKDEIEKYVGGVKFDLLGLRTLTIIDNTLKLLNQKGIHLDLEDLLSLDDPEIYKMLAEGNTEGVFQFDTNTGKKVIMDIKPKEFNDIVAATAINRPGVLGAKDENGVSMSEHYVRRKFGLEKIEYEHPLMEQVLKNTYGVWLYQETLMQLVKIMAGYTNSESDDFRRVIGKKIPEGMVLHEEKFINGCINNGIDREVAQSIFNKMKASADYLFNLSHSVSYSILTYYTAFLKRHYPTEFMCSVLNSVINDTEDLKVYIEHCKKLDIKILPPDILKSNVYFSIEAPYSIRFGLLAIKGIGKSGIDKIIKFRNEENIKDLSFVEFFFRSKINKTVCEALIKAGAFDCMGYKRKGLLEALPLLVDSVQRIKNKIARLKLKQWDDITEYYNIVNDLSESNPLYSSLFSIDISMQEEYSSKELLKLEKDLFGFYLINTPLNVYEKEYYRKVTCTSDMIPVIGDKKLVIVGGIIKNLNIVKVKTGRNLGKLMALFELEDYDGIINVVIYSQDYEKFSRLLNVDEAVLVIGNTNIYEGKTNVIAKDIKPLGCDVVD